MCIYVYKGIIIRLVAVLSVLIEKDNCIGKLKTKMTSSKITAYYKKY